MSRHPDGTMEVPLLPFVKASRKVPVGAADKDVMDAVERALMADASLDGIRLTSVEDGLVLLAGSTTSLVHELRAIGAVYRIPGVRYVASGIEARDDYAADVDHGNPAANVASARDPASAGAEAVVGQAVHSARTRRR